MNYDSSGSSEKYLSRNDLPDHEEADNSRTVKTSLGGLNVKQPELLFINDGGFKLTTNSRSSQKYRRIPK